MNAKVISILLLFVLITLSLSAQACQDSTNSLQVLSLEITPPKILAGERANVKAEVRNDSDKMETYDIPLMVNGVADNRKYVTLAPGVNETIEFSLRRDKAGVYAVRIGEQKSTLEVREPLPSTFKLSKLEISPTESNVNEQIIIKADIANIGEVKGKYTAVLKINGVTTKTDEMIMLPGSSSFILFKIFPDSLGTYWVNLGELTGQFSVLEPVIPNQVITPPCPPTKTWDPKQRC